jgi:hypothetical protein
MRLSVPDVGRFQYVHYSLRHRTEGIGALPVDLVQYPYDIIEGRATAAHVE